MVQIINLRSLFEKLAPELSKRLQRSHLAGWRGALLIATRNERITLQIDGTDMSVALADDHAAHHAIEGGEEVALLVLGTEAPCEIASSAGTVLKGDASQLLEVLFPKQYPQMGNADL